MTLEEIEQKPANTEPPTTVGKVKEPEEPMPPADTTPPAVVEVGWYSDEQGTEMLTADSVVRPGDTVYAVVVFSEAMRYTIANNNTARPALFAAVNDIVIRLRPVPSTASGSAFINESAKMLGKDSDRFVCKMIAGMAGTVSLRIGIATADLAGNTIDTVLTYSPPFAALPEPTEPEQPTGPDQPTEPLTQEEEYRAHYVQYGFSEETIERLVQYHIEGRHLRDAYDRGEISA